MVLAFGHFRVLILAAALGLAALLAPGVADAGVAPANDDFPGTAIGGLPFTETVDTTYGSVEVDEPVSECTFENVATAWWSFTATDTAVLIARAKSDDFAPLLTVWAESSFPGGGLTEVWCDGFPGFPEDPPFPGFPALMDVSFPFQADAGKTYYVQVGGFDDFFFGGSIPAAGVVELALSVPTPPPNDDLADAEAIPGLPFEVDVEVTAATTEAGEAQPSCLVFPGVPLEAASTAWYTYTPTEDTGIVIDASLSEAFPFVAVYRGTAPALTEVGCGFDLLTFEALAGETYYIQAGTVVFSDFPGFFGGMIRFTMQEFEPLVCPTSTAQQWPDPAGDTLGGLGFQADATRMSVVSSAQVACFTLEFEDLRLGSDDNDDYTIGFLNFDVDQNPTTGDGRLGEEPCMAAGQFGYEAAVAFTNTGTLKVVPIYLGIVPQGAAPPPLATLTYSGDSVTIAVPVAPLGDASFDVIVQVYSAPTGEATDCLPNEGVATVTGPVVVRFGDVNCSGQVNAGDVRDILAHAGGIDGQPSGDCAAIGDTSGFVYPLSVESPLINGDVDCSGEADSRDALRLLLHLSGAAPDVSACPDPGTPPIQ